MSERAADRVRLDRWMKTACITKTRSVAAALCDGGKVRVNGAGAKPARLVGVGDRIEVQQGGRLRRLTIEAVAHHSVSRADARLLYSEAPPTPEEARQAELDAQVRRAAAAMHPPRFKGRPTKRERRKLDEWKRQ